MPQITVASNIEFHFFFLIALNVFILYILHGLSRNESDKRKVNEIQKK